MRYRHGILILNGFYEFAKSGQSVGFGPKESDSMLVPCLYDSWTSADGQKQLDSFAVITEETADFIQEYGYHRSPINLREEHMDTWLRPKSQTNKNLHEILTDKADSPYIALAS